MGIRDTHSDSAEAARRTVVWHARVCAFAGAIVCSGLAAPATARAAGPVGMDEVSGEVQAALTEINALVPQAPAQSWGPAVASVPNTAPAPAAPAAADGAIAFELAATAEPAVTVPSSPVATMSTGTGSPLAAPGAVPASTRAAAELSARPERPHALVRAAARSTSRRTEAALGSSAAFASGEHSVAQAVVTSRTVLATGAARVTRARDARPKHKAPAGVVPQRLPPVPLPPRPDMTSSGQAGGQGLLLPLVMAALAAALAIFVFELLRRALPRSAFRKPRRIALPPWHPG